MTESAHPGPDGEQSAQPVPVSPDTTVSPRSINPGGATPLLPPGFEATGPPLGIGTTAVVWPARRLVDGREFALKVWRRPLADLADRQRFRREVREHAALNKISGHVVTYSWAEEDPPGGPPWISTERHGVSLEHLADKRSTPLPQRLTLSADLLAGLAALHDHGRLHRDVKPGNVVAEHGRAKLCDLGLVMDSADFTRDNAAGTPRYVAPELLDGTAAPSPRTDVYSAAQTIRQLLGSTVPEPLQQLLTEAGSVNPADRPADAREFERRLRVAATTLGHSPPPPLPPHPPANRPPDLVPPEQNSRHRPHALVLAAVVVLLVLGAAVALTLDRLTTSSRTAGEVTATPDPQEPNAALADPDITADGQPVVLPRAESGRCNVVLPGAVSTGGRPYSVDTTLVAVVQTWYSPSTRQACAKLVKPRDSPYAGTSTHLALTLCGDGNFCDHDWHAYPTDAGPAIVPSQNGCISWRVSMLDDTGRRWLIRDDVQTQGCAQARRRDDSHPSL
jgi:serine/threonine protein kinase